MGLETGSFPSDLVVTNPTGTDLKSQGDDHLRLIKTVIKTTFPNINAAVTATPAQLNTLALPGTTCFSGMIVMWSGVGIPSGWKLCDGVGTVSNGSAVPDLRDRFIIGAGTSYAVGATGGAATHGHTVTVNNHTLTIDQIPPHTHTTGQAFAAGGVNGATSGGQSLTTVTGSTGGGQGHNHTASANSSNHLPPYYALAFIIKD